MAPMVSARLTIGRYRVIRLLGQGGFGARADRLSHEDVRSLMLGMPFRKFEQRKYLEYDRQDLA